jgi:hypothetical protein
MSPNQSCQYCGNPLSPDAQFCEACGQPIATGEDPPQDVPQSYIDTGEPDEIQSLEPPQASATAASVATPPPPTVTGSTAEPARSNNCLRIAIIVAFAFMLVCCCVLVSMALLFGYAGFDSVFALNGLLPVGF